MENQLALEELSRQRLFINDVAEMMKVRARGPVPVAYVRTYGCQQNVADGEKIKGLLSEMGFSFADSPEDADFILFNTCAVREHAEDRVFGNVGALKNIKRRHPSTIIAVCGCMTEQERVVERFKKSYPFVNLVFGTHVIHRLPEMLYTAITDSKRVFLRGHEGEEVLEGIPTRRDGTSRAWVTVMLGCDNFCSYCIVPYVRGREKSRRPEEVVKECRQLIEAGYKEITLLGQNVNSYGKGLEEKVNFAELLRRIDAIPALPVRQRPGVKRDEPPLYPGAVFGADPLCPQRHAGRQLYLRRDCGLSRGDLRGVSGHSVSDPGGGVYLFVYLYLLPKGGNTGCHYARSCFPPGKDGMVWRAFEGPGGNCRPPQRRHGGADLPGAGGGAKRKIRPAFRPYGFQRGD